MTTTAAHYRLTSDEFLTINSQLTNAQLRVYLHYKTLDPFGDRRVEICTKAIAETLGMAQRTVQLALRKLSSMGLIIWERSKSFIRRSCDRLSDLQIVKAITRSPKRSQDRERQLELNLGAGSESSQSSSVFINLDQDHDDDFLNDSGDVIHYDSIEDSIDADQISVDEAIAEVQAALCADEDLHLSNENETEQSIDENQEPETGLQLSKEQPTNKGEGDSFRRAVENFILKKLGKSPKNRAAYFASFSKASWQKWEMDYKASLVTPPPYKPYIPEKVEVASPDSPVAQSAIAFIKQKLGMK